MSNVKDEAPLPLTSTQIIRALAEAGVEVDRWLTPIRETDTGYTVDVRLALPHESDAEPWSVWEYRQDEWREMARSSRTDALRMAARRERAGCLGLYLALPMSQTPSLDQAPQPMRSVKREQVKA